MRTGIDPVDEIRVYDPGYEDGEADIFIPRPILAAMNIKEGRPILVRVTDEAPVQLEIIGQAPENVPTHPYTFTATPAPDNDPDYPPRFQFTFPRAWKGKHWLQPVEDRNEWGDDPYQVIEADHDLDAASSFLTSNGTLVIPL